MFLVLPGFDVPAAFVFRSLDQADEPVGLDEFNAALDDSAVGVWPMVGQLGDRRGAMSGEPCRFHFAHSYAPCHDDLERSLAQRERGRLVGIFCLIYVSALFVDDAV